jgi:hypothetical protein
MAGIARKLGVGTSAIAAAIKKKERGSKIEFLEQSPPNRAL